MKHDSTLRIDSNTPHDFRLTAFHHPNGPVIATIELWATNPANAVELLRSLANQIATSNDGVVLPT